METPIIKQHYEKTLTGFLYSIFGITLPFILSLIGILIIKEYNYIVSFIDDGQILLFSAGLLTSAYYIFRDEENQKSLKKSQLRYDRILSHLSFMFLIITSVMYAILYSFRISNENIDLNIWFVRISSVILFGLSVYSAYRSIYLDFLKVYPIIDVKKESNKCVNKIIEEL